MYMPPDKKQARELKTETKQKKKRTRKPKVKTENKENLASSKRKRSPAVAKFSQKSLMKKDPTLKLNTTFLPQIPYLTPLDT